MRHISRAEIKEIQMRIIGLTGSVGSGKSTVGKLMEEHFNVRLQMTDEIGHLAYQKGTESYEQIIQLLGKVILDEDKEINRKLVADKVFQEERLLEQLNSIIHPWVKQYLSEDMEQQKKKKEYSYYVIESAIMFQTGLDRMCDEVWYVDAEDAVRRERLKSDRGYSDDKINNIMDNQWENAKRKEQCQQVINNNGNKSLIMEQLEKLLV